MGDIDPKLLEQISKAGDNGQVEAMILVEPSAATRTAPRDDKRGPGGTLLDRVTKQLPDKPVAVRFMPRLGALVVKGSSRLVKRLIDDPTVISATVNEGEVTRL